MTELECKKCERTIEIPMGLIADYTLDEIKVFIKHHKKHGIFAIGDKEPVGYIKVTQKEKVKK